MIFEKGLCQDAITQGVRPVYRGRVEIVLSAIGT